MQDCGKYDIMLNARVDGTLNKKDAKELDKHLAVCADCRKYLQLLEDIRDGLREELPDPPETLREGIMYKIGLEKHRKLHFGATGRWTAIAAVLCIVVFGVVKLTGSGVVGASAAAPQAADNTTYSLVEGLEDAPKGTEAEKDRRLEESKLVLSSTMAVPGEAPAAVPTAGGSIGSEAETDESSAVDGFGADNGSVYMAESLRGYDLARAALDSGNYRGVCVFYGALPKEIGTGNWQAASPGEGEKERWLLSLEALEDLEKAGPWDEFYFGDWNADQGLVIVIAGEEE